MCPSVTPGSLKRRIYAAKFSQSDAENPEKHRKSYDNTTKIDNDAGNLAA